jgi:hypothetical protein
MMVTLVVRLSDEEVQDLYRIIIDEEVDDALAFLTGRVKPKLDEALEGGCKVMINVPGQEPMAVRGLLR